MKKIIKYIKKFLFIWLFVFAFFLGGVTFLRSSALLLTPEGFYNFLLYLLDTIIPSIAVTGTICMVILVYKLIFWGMLYIFNIGNTQAGDESFVYIVDVEKD